MLLVTRVGGRLRRCDNPLDVGCLDPAVVQGDFEATDLHALPDLDRTDEVASLEQRVVRAGVVVSLSRRTVQAIAIPMQALKTSTKKSLTRAWRPGMANCRISSEAQNTIAVAQTTLSRSLYANP
jgi:hypothetical protein